MLSKEELVRALVAARRNAVVVTTMSIVRTWGRYSNSDLDFASADSAMGHSADLALGIALAQPKRKVICLNGDGSMLMTLGSLATIVEARAENLILLIVQNETFEITGNQPIPAANRIDFSMLARGVGFKNCYNFDDVQRYEQTLDSILKQKGPTFLTVKVESGNEGPLSRGSTQEVAYLKPSLAESAHQLRETLLAERCF